MKIEIGITHEILINGEKSWVRLAITDDYDISDKIHGDLDKAVSDLSIKVNEQLIKVISQTAEIVNEYSN